MKDKPESQIKPKDRENKIQEIQILEQNMQNLILQKQAFQLELSETKAAQKEIENSGEIFKIIGQLMIKTEKEKTRQELANKEKLLELRINSIEKQESSLNERIESLKKDIF